MTSRLLDDVPLTTLTTRQIARHAGVSDGVLYNHFADKNELVIAALLDRYARLVAQLEADAPGVGQGTVETNLRTLARALVHLHEEALLLGAALLADPDLLKRFWVEIHRSPYGPGRLVRPLAVYLAGERDLGRVAPTIDVNAAVTLLLGASAMLGLTHRLNPGTAGSRADGDLDAVIATLLRGLQRESPRSRSRADAGALPGSN
jgi:AcrR family transcriptional regulator